MSGAAPGRQRAGGEGCSPTVHLQQTCAHSAELRAPAACFPTGRCTSPSNIAARALGALGAGLQAVPCTLPWARRSGRALEAECLPAPTCNMLRIYQSARKANRPLLAAERRTLAARPGAQQLRAAPEHSPTAADLGRGAAAAPAAGSSSWRHARGCCGASALASGMRGSCQVRRSTSWVPARLAQRRCCRRRLCRPGNFGERRS